MEKCKFNAVLLLLLFPLLVSAQHKTLLISESGLPYTEQTWLTTGVDNALDGADIAANWNLGKRVVTADYTSEGWLVVMAKNTPYTEQTFTLSPEWPEEWIAQKTALGYAITTVGRSPGEWLVVMSQGSGISRQSVWLNSWEQLAPWITEQKNQGYVITDLAYDGKRWAVVMSQDAPYASQGYFFVNSTGDLMGKVQADVWGRGYNLQQVKFGEDSYIVVYGNYRRNDGRYQNLQLNPDSPRDYIRRQWDKGICIAFVGGGTLQAWQKPVKKSWVAK